MLNKTTKQNFANFLKLTRKIAKIGSREIVTLGPAPIAHLISPKQSVSLPLTSFPAECVINGLMDRCAD